MYSSCSFKTSFFYCLSLVIGGFLFLTWFKFVRKNAGFHALSMEYLWSIYGVSIRLIICLKNYIQKQFSNILLMIPRKLFYLSWTLF
ncbi:MAG TPA: hypothetical protein DHV22_00935 [Xanthomarina gelatinilytica]|uniref:Uncharacterized protein n=1 Tax=Xanthomarina gelatinilytica TaxID=1137281 RepID=A0A3D6BM30_9FLAO|nr:hypothetical protein [Xanthomarina gelatinilytica]